MERVHKEKSKQNETHHEEWEAERQAAEEKETPTERDQESRRKIDEADEELSEINHALGELVLAGAVDKE